MHRLSQIRQVASSLGKRSAVPAADEFERGGEMMKAD